MRAGTREDQVVMSRIAFCFIASVLALSVSAVELSDSQRAEVEERIRPVGEVCMEGDSSCGGAATASASSGPRSGEEVYNAACMACHAKGVGSQHLDPSFREWRDPFSRQFFAQHRSNGP